MKWSALREIPSIRSLYSENNSDAERLPLTIRDAIDDSSELQKIPTPDSTLKQKKEFLNRIGQLCKKDETVQASWNQWVKECFPGQTAERTEAVLKVFQLTLDVEAQACRVKKEQTSSIEEENTKLDESQPVELDPFSQMLAKYV